MEAIDAMTHFSHGQDTHDNTWREVNSIDIKILWFIWWLWDYYKGQRLTTVGQHVTSTKCLSLLNTCHVLDINIPWNLYLF